MSNLTDEMVKNLIEAQYEVVSDETLENNSFRNFHVKGVDYICLHRTQEITVKLYVFHHNFESENKPYVVNFHNHGYNFYSYVIKGYMENHVVAEIPGPDGQFKKYHYHTPLKGYTEESRFGYVGKCNLEHRLLQKCRAGKGYYLHYKQIHSIIVPNRPEPTVLGIVQYEDLGMPYTNFYTRSEPPQVTGEGKYERFSASDARKELQKIFG